MKIPVFHDDQHGTAIVVGAAATNARAWRANGSRDVKIVSTGGRGRDRLSQHAAEARGAAREYLRLRLHGPSMSAGPRT